MLKQPTKSGPSTKSGCPPKRGPSTKSGGPPKSGPSTKSAPAKKEPSREDVYALAALAAVALRTAKRALMFGIDAIKGEEVRKRLRAALGPR